MFKSVKVKNGCVRELAVIALPMVISQACDTIMIFTDRLFLSKLGSSQMNASLGGGLTVFMMVSFLVGLISFSTALIAQYLGSGRKDRCAVVLTQALLIAMMMYVPILFCRPFAHAFFGLLGVPAEQLNFQKVYFDILLYGVIINLFRTAFGSFFSGVGRTRVVFISSFVAMIVNTILNYGLIFGHFGLPALGMAGSAYGTILGGVCGLAVFVFFYLSEANIKEFNIRNSLKFDLDVFKKLWRFGSPNGAELFFNILAFNTMVLIFHSHGTVTATAATIVFNWDLVSFLPLIGVEVGVISLVGRYMGGRDPDSAHRATMSGFKMGLVYSLLILIAFLVFPRYLVDIFAPSADQEVFIQAAPLAVDMIRMAAVYVLVEAMFFVFLGALRGAGDTWWAMVISVTCHWLLVVATFVLLKIFHFSPLVAWASVVTLFFIFSFIALFRYLSGQWRNIRMVEEPAALIITDSFHEIPEV